MHDDFVAVRAGTDLRAYASDLRASWDASFSTGRADGVRAVIADSWTRMLGTGVAPDQLRPTTALGEDDLAAARAASPLRACLDDLRGSLGSLAEDAEHIMVVCDADGRLLWIEGHDAVLEQARGIDFVPGMLWTEGSAGTNAIGTALAIDHAVQVFSAEHFLPEQHPWWCSAAPIHDPVTGALLGVVDISGPQRTAHPYSLGLVTAAAEVAERGLARAAAQRRATRVPDRAAPPAPSRRAGAAPLGARPVSGRLRLLGEQLPTLSLPCRGTASLTPRQADVLAVLADAPEGRSAEQLAGDLYGDAGRAVTARALVSRLQDVAGPVLSTQPYRLHPQVRTDLRTIRALLRRGDGRTALATYAGPLLPRSTAPAVERLRVELDMAVRNVALAGDADMLWRWLATPTGDDDLAALERFTDVAPRSDPRRAAAEARRAAVQASWAGTC